MIANRRQLLKYPAQLIDLCVLVSSFVIAAILPYSSLDDMTFETFMATRIKLSNILLFGVLLFTWHSIFGICGLYVSKRLIMRRAQIVEVCKAVLLASGVLLGAAKAFHIRMVTPTFVVVFGVVCLCLMVTCRLVARSILVAVRSRGRNRRFILILGTNHRATRFAHQLVEHPELGYTIVGFVDDDWPGISEFEASGHVRCATFSGLAHFLRHNVVDEAAIFLPLRSYYEHAAQLVSLCEQHGIAIRFDTQIFKLNILHSDTQDPEENPQVLVGGTVSLWPVILKRVLDCVVSLLLLILLVPVFLVVALLVKCSSPGPVFFRQTRVGLNKRQFAMYKFRTMITNAEQLQDQLLALNEMTGPVFKIKKDPRITPIGRVLRKTSVDELPQLFNVLRGDMSLVGPRAIPLRDYRLFDQDWHRRRFSVKPGITCLWQIHGRNSIPFEKWMELDMQYIDKWSLWLDFKILARTLPVVLRGTGAA